MVTAAVRRICALTVPLHGRLSASSALWAKCAPDVIASKLFQHTDRCLTNCLSPLRAPPWSCSSTTGRSFLWMCPSSWTSRSVVGGPPVHVASRKGYPVYLSTLYQHMDMESMMLHMNMFLGALDAESMDGRACSLQLQRHSQHHQTGVTNVDALQPRLRLLSAYTVRSVSESSALCQVVETSPNVKGNTVSGGSKPATLETGAVVAVPLFIEVGETIKVDTKSGVYLSRA